MDLSIYNQSGTQVGTMPVDEASLGGEVRPALLKQAFVMFHANTRQGSARTKSRGMVEGSTRKLYKQKGSGNARMGAARTVIRKGGGVALPRPEPGKISDKPCPRRCGSWPTGMPCSPSWWTTKSK